MILIQSFRLMIIRTAILASRKASEIQKRDDSSLGGEVGT